MGSMRQLPVFRMILATVILGALSQLAEAGPLKYDPATCKEEAVGKLYIALGRIVLAVPNDGVAGVGELEPALGDKPLNPPNPADPEGCPGNPQQLWAYEFRIDLGNISATSLDQTGSSTASGALDRLTLHRLNEALPDQIWAGEELNLKLASSACARAAYRKNLPNGLKVCLLERKDESTPMEDWAATYVASPDLYKTPLGRQFVIVCDPVDHQALQGECYVMYSFQPGLGVEYRFRPQLGPQPIPIDQILDLDRRLRAEIDAAIVTQYRWAD